MTKRILIITGSFYPAQEGGPTNAVYWLASGLAFCHYDVHVVASSKGLSENVQLDTWQTLNGFHVIYNSPGEGKAIIKEEITLSDCLLRSGVCNVRAHISNMRYLKNGKKLILSPRGELFYPAIFHKGKVYGLLKLFFLKIMGLLYSNKIVYHATSSEEKEQIQKIWGHNRKILTIPNYMIIPNYINDSIRTKKYNNIIYVGRLSPIKAIDKLVLALSMSQMFMKGTSKLIILGECKGDYYVYLNKLINDLNLNEKVDFRGVVTGRDKDILIANSRFLFLVSESENFGNVVIEALAQGTPVVASKGTPWSNLKNKEAGFWVSNNPKSLASIIDIIYQLPDNQYNKLRDNAFEYSKEFDIYLNISIWKRAIENL